MLTWITPTHPAPADSAATAKNFSRRVVFSAGSVLGCRATRWIGMIGIMTSHSADTTDSPTAPANPANRVKVVADVDTGIDDALALTYLAHLHASGRIELGVTTSAGNCGAAQAAANSADVLAACGVDVPVVAGAAQPVNVELVTTPETHGPTGLGHYITSADPADYPPNVEEAVASWEGADYLLIAGPATNLAWALEHCPDVLDGTEVCLMTGAFNYPGNTTPLAEWNAWVDPHALGYSLERLAQRSQRRQPQGSAGLPTLCPLNVTETVLLYPDRLERWLEGSEGEEVASTRKQLKHLLSEALRFYFEFHQTVGVGYCAQIHDLAAAMVMLGRVPFSVRAGAVEVEAESALTRGATLVDWDGGYWQKPANAKILQRLDPLDVFAEFERVVFG